MSYILDALRRADAERERDPARGIHAQPAAGTPARARSPVPGWAWPAGAVLIVAAAGVVAWQHRAPAAPPSEPPRAAAVPAPAVPAPAVPAVAAVVLPPAPPPPVVVERVRVVTAPLPAPKGAATVPAAAPLAMAKVPAPVAASLPASAPPAADRIFNVMELPADIQHDLPKLAITGGVYSENAAQRMLVVGGQVVNEGAELAPGVVLDQIRARGAVLRFRGYRYSVTY